MGAMPTAQSGRAGSGCLDDEDVKVLIDDEDDVSDDYAYTKSITSFSKMAVKINLQRSRPSPPPASHSLIHSD